MPKILKGGIRALISPLLLAYLSIGDVAAAAKFLLYLCRAPVPSPPGSVLKAPPPPPLKNGNAQVKQTLATCHAVDINGNCHG